MNTEFDAKRFSEALGIEVIDADLFQESVTHRSYLNEHRGYRLDHNERLEFLGDAVLELVVTDYLYRHYPNPEGELTSFRASIVNGEILAEIAGRLGLGDFLLMSRGEAKDTGRARMWLLANAIEAVIGALYLDQGYGAARVFIERNVISELPRVIEAGLHTDPKSRFQELSQEKTGITPSYRVLKEWGPDHDRHFTAGVFLNETLVAEGEGASKQEAQRAAAAAAIAAKGWG
ncbi:MAG: ribonuclease III [Candidatus Moranbacteria bacterium]|nr:ribonuclease III [Candidatus Moranbacteria bacterium]NTW45639.1 ribonuclease III [Candidatus Moranbacteria bacterium]